jgi:hypothetical protein
MIRKFAIFAVALFVNQPIGMIQSANAREIITTESHEQFSIASYRDLPDDRVAFLNLLEDSDLIQVTWSSIDMGDIPPVTPFGKYHLSMYPIVTWEGFRLSNPQANLRLDRSFSKNDPIQAIHAKFDFSGSDLEKIVKEEGAVSSPKCPIDRSGYKIAINLEDQFYFGFILIRSFNPVYLDISDLLSAPHFTRTYELTFPAGDDQPGARGAKAEIEITLIRRQ